MADYTIGNPADEAGVVAKYDPNYRSGYTIAAELDVDPFKDGSDDYDIWEAK